MGRRCKASDQNINGWICAHSKSRIISNSLQVWSRIRWRDEIYYQFKILQNISSKTNYRKYLRSKRSHLIIEETIRFETNLGCEIIESYRYVPLLNIYKLVWGIYFGDFQFLIHAFLFTFKENIFLDREIVYPHASVLKILSNPVARTRLEIPSSLLSLHISRLISPRIHTPVQLFLFRIPTLHFKLITNR